MYCAVDLQAEEELKMMKVKGVSCCYGAKHFLLYFIATYKLNIYIIHTHLFSN